jgi:hypothetical protein
VAALAAFGAEGKRNVVTGHGFPGIIDILKFFFSYVIGFTGLLQVFKSLYKIKRFLMMET